MYNFEGQFRRTPQQNLAGASVKCARDELLRKAHADREKRENERKMAICATCIQAWVRGFLVRQNFKRINREEFDSLVSNSLPLFCCMTLDTSSITIALTEMANRFLYFYSDQTEDDQRLVMLMHRLIVYKDRFVHLICSNEHFWLWKLRRLLIFCLRNMVKSPEIPNSIYFRSLELFLSRDLYSTVVGEERALCIIIDIYKHIIDNGYYQYMRKLVDTRMPPMLNSKVQTKNYISTTMANFIEAPLTLISQTDDPEYRHLIYFNLINAFLYPEYTASIKSFVLPHLKSSHHLSFKSLVECAYHGHFKYRESSWLLASVLTLENSNFLLSCNELEFRCYLELLSIHSKRFDILHDHYFRQRRSKDNRDDDSDDDDDDEDDNNASKNDKMDVTVTEPLEIKVLMESANYMNVWERVDYLVNRVTKIQSPDVKESVVCSLANICFSLIDIKPRALYEYKLLTRLAILPSFLHDLWTIISKMEKLSLFGSSKRYLNLIRQGIELDVSDIRRFIPLLSTFCFLFSLFSYTLDDSEFISNYDGHDKRSGLPFTRDELLNICVAMKDMCVGFVEMSFPDMRREFKTYFPTIRDEAGRDAKFRRLLESSFEAVVTLVQHLYARDLRCQFTSNDMWISDRLRLVKPNKPLSGINFLLNMRLNILPFSGPPTYSRKDLEEGPPPSSKQLRTLLMMKHVPFLVPFEDRVMVFQSCVLKDKLIFQGDAPYVNRTNNVEVNIRRNFIYEDAFDKLSPTNEPELRYVLRVQMKTALGTEELGIDGGGVFREFMSELLKTAFDPNRGFFCVTSDNHLYPNPDVELIHPNFESHYFFIGRMLGKALYENLLVELPLASFFLSKLAINHSDLDIHHLQSLDPLVYKNLIYLKNYEGDASELGLDFTIVNSALGTTKVIELKRGGANIPVTNANKLAYIYLVADYKLNKQIGRQYNSFKAGLTDVIRPEWLHMFSNKDLQILISGAEVPIDIDDLKTHAKYSGGFSSEHPTIVLFWRVLEEFDDPTRKLLLKFVTSCSKPPLFGFKDLDPPFCIQNVGDRNRLPTASTCMNLLKMPPYDDYETLRDRLVYSIKSGAGFELS